MANNDFLPFAPGAQNVDSQATYAAGGGYRVNGFAPGIAISSQANKVWRQCAAISAMIGGFMSSQNQNANDDGQASALLAGFIAALTSLINTVTAGGGGGTPAATGFTTGDLKSTFKTTADSGWVMCNDGSIGDASSAATTRANADTQTLFILLWNNFSNANCPVSGGRAGSAAADYAAHKTIALPPMMGRALAVAGQGSGLTLRALGDHLGEEKHTMTGAELVTHNHALNTVTTGTESAAHTHSFTQSNFQIAANVQGPGSFSKFDNAQAGTTGTESNTHTHTLSGSTDVVGSSAPFNVIQPTTFANMMVKL